MTPDTKWLLIEISKGLQKLATLSLDRTPAAELLTATAKVWHEALTLDRSWDEERDAPRIHAAFRTIAANRDQWPAPRHLIDALPAHELRAIDYEVKPATPEQAAKRMAEIRETLGLDRPKEGEAA